jgi:CRP/FNR family cyclic AMP-dependent transcriptional regulator
MTSLGAIPALRDLPPAALRAVARRSSPAAFGAGALIRPAGEPVSTVLLLLSGSVAAVHVAASGRQVWTQQWTGPAIADKPATLDTGTPSTGLMAVTAVSARLLSRSRFLRLLEEQESVRTHVLGQLAGDVMTGRRRLAGAVTLPAVAQVAAWLHAQEPADRVVWRGSQEELAWLLGLSRVTVNRALAQLAGAGVVALTRHGIVVSDRARLGGFPAGP